MVSSIFLLMNWPIELVSDQRGENWRLPIDLRAAEFVSVLALHSDESSLLGRALGEVCFDDVANKEGRENKKVMGTLLCRPDFTIVAIVKGRRFRHVKLTLAILNACVLLQ